jgi:transcriptional regulator with XRE-family HTH domain
VSDDARVTSTVRSRLARQFRAARLDSGLSQARLAALMSDLGYAMVQQTINRIESGERDVTIDEAVALAGLLGMRVDEMTLPSELRIAGVQLALAERDYKEAEQRCIEAERAWQAARRRVEELEGKVER